LDGYAPSLQEQEAARLRGAAPVRSVATIDGEWLHGSQLTVIGISADTPLIVTLRLPLPPAPTPTVSSSVSPGRSDATFRPIEVSSKPPSAPIRSDPKQNPTSGESSSTSVHAFAFHGKLDVRQRRIGDDLRKVFDKIQLMGHGRSAVSLRGGLAIRGIP
jgi:hypothetical protein